MGELTCGYACHVGRVGVLRVLGALARLRVLGVLARLRVLGVVRVLRVAATGGHRLPKEKFDAAGKLTGPVTEPENWVAWQQFSQMGRESFHFRTGRPSLQPDFCHFNFRTELFKHRPSFHQELKLLIKARSSESSNKRREEVKSNFL